MSDHIAQNRRAEGRVCVRPDSTGAFGPSPLPRMSRVGKQGVLGSCAQISMGSSVVELCHRKVWSAGPVCTSCREEPEPVQGSEPQAGEVGTDEPTQSSCLMCPRGAFRLQEHRFREPPASLPSFPPTLPPSVNQEFSLISYNLSLLLGL